MPVRTVALTKELLTLTEDLTSSSQSWNRDSTVAVKRLQSREVLGHSCRLLPRQGHQGSLWRGETSFSLLALADPRCYLLLL